MATTKTSAKAGAKTAAKKTAAKKTTAARKPSKLHQLREHIVGKAWWCHTHYKQFAYTMNPDRADWLHRPVEQLPIATDCSGWVTLLYKWAGAPDPSGLDYETVGYTGTLLDHAYKNGEVTTDLSRARLGDLIVVGTGTGDHVVVVIGDAGSHDPLVMSHGDPGIDIYHALRDPRRPHRVCKTLGVKKT